MKQLFVLAVGAVAALNATPARAQATTTFVSGFGFDTNPCTVAAPCRSFQRAHDQTTAGGQITMLDAAGYGSLTITKAISIVNDGGGMAGITDPGASNAITISAGASDVVNLRGLTLNGVGTGQSGVVVDSGGTLNIQNCVIRDFSIAGVSVPSLTPLALTISDTIIPHNGTGILVEASNGSAVTASLERVAAIGQPSVEIEFFASGTGTIRAKIVDSVAVGANGGIGFQAGGTGTTVTLINSKALSNLIGLDLLNGATMYISGTTVAGNSADGFVVSGAGSSLNSFGDNYIIDTSNSGSLTPISEQ